MQLNVFVLYGHPGYLWSSSITNSHIWSWCLQAPQGPTHFQKLSHLCVGVDNLDCFVANWAVFASSMVILYCDRSMLTPDKSDHITKGKLCCTLVSRLLFLTWFQWSINFIATKQWNQRLWSNIISIQSAESFFSNHHAWEQYTTSTADLPGEVFTLPQICECFLN